MSELLYWFEYDHEGWTRVFHHRGWCLGAVGYASVHKEAHPMTTITMWW